MFKKKIKKNFITKISKTFDFFGQKIQKEIVMFFSLLSYRITQLLTTMWFLTGVCPTDNYFIIYRFR